MLPNPQTSKTINYAALKMFKKYRAERRGSNTTWRGEGNKTTYTDFYSGITVISGKSLVMLVWIELG